MSFANCNNNTDLEQVEIKYVKLSAKKKKTLRPGNAG